MFVVQEGHTRVWHCGQCGHTQTAPLPDLAQFYAEEYNKLKNSVTNIFETLDAKANYEQGVAAKDTS